MKKGSAKWGRDLQTTHLTRDLDLEDVKNSYNSLIQNQPNLKMGRGPE